MIASSPALLLTEKGAFAAEPVSICMNIN